MQKLSYINQNKKIFLCSELFIGIIKMQDYLILKSKMNCCDLNTHLVIEVDQDQELCDSIDKYLACD